MLPWIISGPASGTELDRQRETFLLAERAFERGDTVAYLRHRTSIREYPLYPYLLYTDLRQRLGTDSTADPTDEIRQFLTTYDDSPLADRLRTAWLKQLADAQRWRDYLRYYRRGDDKTLNCYQRLALLRTGRRTQALDGISKVWMSGRSLPGACDPLFALWKRQGGFKPEQIWRRFALALDKGETRLAHYLAKQLPPGDRTTANLWIRVHENPRLITETNRFDPDNPRTGLILLHGVGRWSHQNSVSAAAALDALKPRFRLPARERIAVERQLALFVASRADPSALDRLTALPPEAVDEQVEAWRVRTGLQRRDWPLTLKWLERLSPELKTRPQWQYWRARALERTGRDQDARRIFRDLAERRDYHGFLAADRLGLPYQLNNAPLKIRDEGPDDLLRRYIGLRRARELYLLNREWQARSEWRHATRSLARQELKMAALLAHRWDWHSQAITTLARTGYWNDLRIRFPLPYRDRVLTGADSQAIDPAWVYAIMRQESLFRPDVKSPAGALGLMQIMPATGRKIAGDLKLARPGDYAILRTDTNIRFGNYYLRYTLDRLQGNPILATAAYNAGPRRVEQWLPERGKVEADIWAETIPFRETRRYVKRVMEFATVYQCLLEGDAAGTMRARMKPVGPAAEL